MLDRNTAPAIQKIQKINFVEPQVLWINDSVKLLWMQDVPNETSRIDLYFNAGLRQDRNVIVSLCSSLLLSGTKQKNSTQIHEQIDQLNNATQYFAQLRMDRSIKNALKLVDIASDSGADYVKFQITNSNLISKKTPKARYQKRCAISLEL